MHSCLVFIALQELLRLERALGDHVALLSGGAARAGCSVPYPLRV